jgi:hypothetical protein
VSARLPERRAPERVLGGPSDGAAEAFLQQIAEIRREVMRRPSNGTEASSGAGLAAEAARDPAFGGKSGGAEPLQNRVASVA